MYFVLCIFSNYTSRRVVQGVKVHTFIVQCSVHSTALSTVDGCGVGRKQHKLSDASFRDPLRNLIPHADRRALLRAYVCTCYTTLITICSIPNTVKYSV